MTGFNFLALFGLICVMCQCEGQVTISPPPGVKPLVFVKGSTAELKWSINGNVDLSVSSNRRNWNFENSAGPTLIAFIDGDGNATIKSSVLPGVDIKKPATLVLKNVDDRYDGKYAFSFIGNKIVSNTVTVIIAVTPKITIECSKDKTINKGDNISCQCSSKDGNPPANVTWYNKNGTKISGTGKKKQELKLTNVDKTDNGSYTCKAFGHELAKNETSIEIIVHYPPENVEVEFPTKMNVAERGKPYTIKCKAEANPPPTYEMFFNETKLQINGDAYTISKVNDSHSGFYHCVAKNTLGSSNSTPSYLRVGNVGQSPTTFPTSKTNLGNKTVETDTSGSEGLGAGAIVGIVIGVLVVVVVVAGVIYWFKCKPNGKDHGPKKDAEEKSKKKRGDENVYDAVNMDDKASGSRSSPELESPMNYAVLDKQALNTGAPKKPDRNAEESTAYASIDVGKVGQVEADLV